MQVLQLFNYENANAGILHITSKVVDTFFDELKWP